MRTTIDMPDELYRSLKARAALRGISLRDLIQQLIEQGLRSSGTSTSRSLPGSAALPVAVPPTGEQIPALSRSEFRRLEEEEDVAKHERSTGH